MSFPSYTPCWWCRLFGHKWWLKRIDERLDEQGNKHANITWHQLTHCDRCGFQNPAI